MHPQLMPTERAVSKQRRFVVRGPPVRSTSEAANADARQVMEHRLTGHVFDGLKTSAKAS